MQQVRFSNFPRGDLLGSQSDACQILTNNKTAASHEAWWNSLYCIIFFLGLYGCVVFRGTVYFYVMIIVLLYIYEGSTVLLQFELEISLIMSKRFVVRIV